MGNAQSSSTPATRSSPFDAGRQRQEAQNAPPKPRRRESIATLSTNKATARPSVTLESATASTSHSSTLSAEESARSIHFPPTPHYRAGSTASQDIMGNQESKQAHDKKGAPYRPSSTKPKAINVPGVDKQQQPAAEIPSPQRPHLQQREEPMGFDDSYLSNASTFSRPPRLPLPIEEELHTPGSPIISPADVSGPVGPIEPLEELPGLPRRSSVLSSTTLDDDDLGDDLGSLEGGPHVPVPTLLEWRESGDKVYVTGTFAGWDRKFRLHKNGPSGHPGALSAIINLQPGTHHVRFIVDNDMKLSKYMPTAVDFTNFLVNYIEVGPEDVQIPIPDVENTQLDGKAPPGTDITQSKPTGGTTAGTQVPETLPTIPQDAPSTQEQKNAAAKAAEEPKDALAEQLIKGKSLVPASPKSYHSKIPQFLIDLDANEESAKFARVNALVNTIPAPPSLPMFLAKSILNGNPPMRDDASVLILPNHTVLNHLATSSIRNGVLATSATTRYKQKFLTTIMYKPTSRDGD